MFILNEPSKIKNIARYPKPTVYVIDSFCAPFKKILEIRQ